MSIYEPRGAICIRTPLPVSKNENKRKTSVAGAKNGQRAEKVAGSEPTEGSSSGTMSSPHPMPHTAHISFPPQSLGFIGRSSPSYFPLYTDIFL